MDQIIKNFFHNTEGRFCCVRLRTQQNRPSVLCVNVRYLRTQQNRPSVFNRTVPLCYAAKKWATIRVTAKKPPIEAQINLKFKSKSRILWKKGDLSMKNLYIK